jgi:hypothetical protein
LVLIIIISSHSHAHPHISLPTPSNMFKNVKDGFKNTTPPKREQRERYKGDEERKTAAIFGPKPHKSQQKDVYRKSEGSKQK